jgi:hypothetical protein
MQLRSVAATLKMHREEVPFSRVANPITGINGMAEGGQSGLEMRQNNKEKEVSF